MFRYCNSTSPKMLFRINTNETSINVQTLEELQLGYEQKSRIGSFHPLIQKYFLLIELAESSLRMQNHYKINKSR